MRILQRWLTDLFNLFMPKEDLDALWPWTELIVGIVFIAFLFTMLAIS